MSRNVFQIYEAYRSTEMLLPSAVLHAVVYLSYLCLIIPVRDLRAQRTISVGQYNLSTLVFALPSLHALCHPIVSPHPRLSLPSRYVSADTITFVNASMSSSSHSGRRRSN